MKENLIKLLKIYGVYSIVPAIISSFALFTDEKLSMFAIFGVALLLPILFIIVFFPTIICLWLIFKKVKNSNWRIFLIAFLIPFTNLIYYLIESQIINPTGMAICSLEVGFCVLFYLLPLLFVTACCVPKTIIPFKKKAILTVVFTFVLGWIMIFGLGVLEGVLTKVVPDLKFTYHNQSTTRELDKYNPMIEYAETYKKENGKYPMSIDNVTIETSKFSIYRYTTYNDGQDYILHVNTPKYEYGEGFNYCTKKELPDCDIGYDQYGNTHKRIGKWIHMYYE